ncbi:MAG: cytochrome P450 [Acidimicrobiia bacterium]|nr:cytochrome P450 [Acidimicrobiia bacterium]
MNAPGTARRAPGPRGIEVVRVLRDFQRSPLPTLERLARQYGDVVSLVLPGHRALLLAHPSLIEHVLLRRSDRYRKSRGTRAGRRFFGDSMQLNNGERALAMRRRLAPLFTFDRLVAAHAGPVVEETRAALAGWTPGARPGLTGELMDLLLHIMVRTHFGTRGADTRRVGALYAEALGLLPGFGLPGWLPTPRNRRYAAAVATLDSAILERLAEQRRADRGDTDLAAEFARLGLPDTQIRHELVSMMAASYNTVGMTLVQTLRLLAEHPDADARVAAEAVAADGETPDVRRLPFIGRVVKESLRLCPPAGLMMRFALADDDVGGWPVPAGTRIMLSSWLVQRDARYYPDPLAFRPDRWTPEFERSLPPCAYFPFGAGARSCIGSVLSDVVLRLIVATIATRFRLEAPVTPPDRTAWPLLMADGGLRATLAAR